MQFLCIFKYVPGSGRRNGSHMISGIREKLKDNMKNMRRKTARILFSAFVTSFMLVLAAFAWDGMPKRLAICVCLALLSGIFLILPGLSNRISLPLLAVYLCFVPKKIFVRMEIPVHDTSRIMDGVVPLTIAFILCVWLLFFIFTQSSAVALGVGSGFFLIVFLTEYYIWKFRGDFLMPSDLKAAGTAMSVMDNYDYTLSPEALYSVIYFLFFVAAGSRIRICMRRWIHVAVSLAAVLFIGGWYYIVMDTENPLGKEFVINYWLMADTRELNGACLSYFLLWKDSRIDIPGEYSQETVQAVAQAAVEEYGKPQEADKKPHIIMIMNEAWSDPRMLGQLETTEPFMPFTDSLEENTLKGTLYVSILGGLTANTEFEALTGNSLALLSPAVIPYQNQVRHDMPSLARILEEQGYQTMSMHPSGEMAWSRNRVYGYFGFRMFIHQGIWEVPCSYVRNFISDACNYREIIYRYENRDPDTPFFLFDVTIQNHGGYYGEIPLDIDVVNVGGIPAGDAGYLYDLQTYINLLKISDDAFAEAVAYFQNEEEPVIICMFGDHQPLLKDDFYNAVFSGRELSEQERNLQKYIVPYVIWANYDVDWVEYGDMSANYLPAVLMECAGLKLPPFYRYLMGLYETYPVLTQRGCLDRDGNLMEISDIWDTDKIRQYRMLQYNQLYEEGYLSGIFEKAGEK